ncbi:MAG: CDP-alcohol phosphatidyltransferase family protein [Candidatus Zixiibacteriota bacterium]|nr:MAG: CDP-alcohol phosphatidyltransferase family protein [candidate division Zixibacteria bacterium]
MSDSPNGILPVRFERWFEGLLQPAVRSFSRWGITPNTLTLASLVFALAAGILLAFSLPLWALIPVIIMGLCDILDGQVARHNHTASQFGAILDSSLDRYTEFLILAGLGVHYFAAGEPWWILVTALALVGSFEISYIKARAEGAGQRCPVGLLQRSERLVLLGLALLLGGWALKAVLALMAVMAHYTALQRLLYLRKIS